MTARKFYRTVISVEVLSEEPVVFSDLDHVYEAISVGDCSGCWKVIATEEVDGATMAKLLIAQASDPEFFGLTDEGEDADEIDDYEDDSDENTEDATESKSY